MDMDLFSHGILWGTCDLQTLPDTPLRVIKVYLSSARTDTVQERDAVQRSVVPRLRQHCKENYGLEFQLIDLNHNIDERLDDLDPGRSLFMQELRTCRENSPGPALVAFVGQKYGDRPLPQHIQADDFDLLVATLRGHVGRDTRQLGLLELWYQKDENAVPPVYVLQPVDRVKDKTPLSRDKDGKLKTFSWEDTRETLQKLIKRGLEYSVLDGDVDEHVKVELAASDLEKEIVAGVLQHAKHQDRCLIMLRTITDIKNYISHPTTAQFIDVTLQGKVPKVTIDEDAENQIHNLKTELEQRLPKENLSAFEVLWRFDDGIDNNVHKDYLDNFTNLLEKQLLNMIDRLSHTYMKTPLPPIVDEVLQHMRRAKQKSRNFIGRDDSMEIIRNYVISNDSKPLVLVGESGSGKSAVIAKATSEVSSWVSGSLLNIVRFIGDSSASFDVRQLLYNICAQIALALNRPVKEIPNTFKELQTHFFNLLEDFPSDKSLVIFLDSLHMLVPQYDAYSLNWLPKTLKENVKIVVSTLPNQHGIMETLKREVIQEENNFLEISSMEFNECQDLLASLLERAGRCLTVEQQNSVNSVIMHNPNPLFIKLLFQKIKSYTSLPEDQQPATFPDSMQGLLQGMFDALEKKHGRMLVSRVLAYLTASTTGLSDCELADILSLDDVLLSHVFKNKNPTIRRMPPLYCQNLKHDILCLLTLKESDGVTVYFWDHKVFVDVCKDRYLADASDRKAIHSMLADYFTGTWHGKKKPLGNGSTKGDEKDRYVPPQPLTYTDFNNTVTFNKRKFDQVPRHLFLSGRLAELNESVLFSYEWLYNKTKAVSLENVLADFVLNPGVESTLVERALRDGQETILEDINNMASEIVGRLLAYYQTHAGIRKLIQECDKAGIRHSALLPVIPYYRIPGSPLKHSLKCKGNAQYFGLVGDSSRFLLVKDVSNPLVEMFDLATGEHVTNIPASVGEMYTSPNGTRLIIVEHTKEKAIKIHDCFTGQYIGQVIPMQQISVKPKEKYKLSKLSMTEQLLAFTVNTDNSYLCIADLHRAKIIHVIGVEHKSTVCALSADSCFVFYNSGENVISLDLESMQKISIINISFIPQQILLKSDGTMGFVVEKKGTTVYTMHLKDGKIDFLYKVNFEESFHDDVINAMTMSNNEEMLLLRGNENIAVYSLYDEKVVCHFSRPQDIPKDFKLPNDDYTDIDFTQAGFSPDDKFVVATIFRHIYIWHVTNNRLLSVLQAPVGIIQELLVPTARGQLVTHMQGNKNVHVWSLGDSIGHIDTLDCMTKSVNDIQITADGAQAFVRCTDSDELGVIDIHTGKMIHLLTHSSPVLTCSITPDGSHVLVATKSTKPNITNVIWYVPERKVLYEFGRTPSHSVALKNTNTIVSVCQDNSGHKQPYHISLFEMNNDGFEEYRLEHEINYLLDEPFVTADDRFLVLLTAEDYDDAHANYVNPTICALNLKSPYTMNCFSASELRDRVRIRRILNVRPYGDNPYSVIVFYTDESDLVEDDRRSRGYDHCYGFMILDVCSGIVCQALEDFMVPRTPLNQVLFTDDASLCIDNQNNIFDMSTGFYVKCLRPSGAGAKVLALRGKVAICCEGQHLHAIRVSDCKVIGHVNCHTVITCLKLCRDQRTLVVGCEDGSIMSYILLDQTSDNVEKILQSIPSRKLSSDDKKNQCSWDRADTGQSPPYSRPPSAAAINTGVSDRDILRKVRPVSRPRPYSDTRLQRNTAIGSRACVVM